MLHLADLVRLDGSKTPVYVDDQRNGHRGFYCSNGYDNKGKKLSVQMTGIEVMVEGHKVDVDSIQHQFQRHQDGDEAPANNESVHANEKHQRSHDEYVLQGNFLYHIVMIDDVIISRLVSLCVQ